MADVFSTAGVAEIWSAAGYFVTQYAGMIAVIGGLFLVGWLAPYVIEMMFTPSDATVARRGREEARASAISAGITQNGSDAFSPYRGGAVPSGGLLHRLVRGKAHTRASENEWAKLAANAAMVEVMRAPGGHKSVDSYDYGSWDAPDVREPGASRKQGGDV